MISTDRLTAWPYAEQATRYLAAVSPYSLASATLAVLAAVIAASAGWGVDPVGDGTLHANLAHQIGASLSLDTEVVSHYPPLYHLFGAAAHGVAGPSGVQAISFIAFGVTSWFTFLFLRELLSSEKTALVSQALVTLSPVLLWYSSLTLMEPMLTATVMVALYSVLRARKTPTLKNCAYVVISLSAVALTKQTGLPVIAASLVFLAISDIGTVSRFGVKRTAVMALAVLVLAAGPYAYLYSRTGAFTDPGSVPVSEINEASWPGSVLTAGIPGRAPEWSVALDAETDSAALYEQGTVLHEARHVYWRNLFDWDRFTWIHTLYPTSFSGYDGAAIPPFHWFLNISLLVGLLTALYAVRGNRNLLLVLLVLGASYIAMSWGTDTKRLFLYVPVVVAGLTVLPYVYWWRRLPRARAALRLYLRRFNLRQHTSPIGIPVAFTGVAVISLAATLPLLSAQFRTLDDYNDTQGGGFDAVGGVDSIREAAAWLNSQLGDDEAFVAASVYEWEYYSERQNLWDEGLDYRTYFLPGDRLDHFLKEAGARYVVVRANQVMEDSEWNHIERVPESFVEKLEAQYPLAYTTTYGDIKVFEVSNSQEFADA